MISWHRILSGVMLVGVLRTSLGFVGVSRDVCGRRVSLSKCLGPVRMGHRLSMSTSSEGGGHDVRGPAVEMSEEEKRLMERIQEHQKTAARLSSAEEVRTLIEYSIGYGVISTYNKELDFPMGSVVGFALDEQARPFFVFSGLSGHTSDVLATPKASLTVTSKDFKGAADGRVSLTGQIEKVTKDEVENLRDLYLRRHPNAFWIDFGDFNYFRMKEIVAIRYVGGFARAGDVTPQEYHSAQPDPIAEFSTHIMGHMNDDHSDATTAMVNHYIGADVESAEIVSLDRLGMTVKVNRKGEVGKLRLPFIRPATDRKSVKDIIVEMTQASSSSAASTS